MACNPKGGQSSPWTAAPAEGEEHEVVRNFLILTFQDTAYENLV